VSEVRSRFEIVANILQTLEEPRGSWTVIRECRLNWEFWRRYRRLLMERDLIQRTGGSYVITNRGRRLLSLLKEVMEIWKRV